MPNNRFTQMFISSTGTATTIANGAVITSTIISLVF